MGRSGRLGTGNESKVGEDDEREALERSGRDGGGRYFAKKSTASSIGQFQAGGSDVRQSGQE